MTNEDRILEICLCLSEDHKEAKKNYDKLDKLAEEQQEVRNEITEIHKRIAEAHREIDQLLGGE